MKDPYAPGDITSAVTMELEPSPATPFERAATDRLLAGMLGIRVRTLWWLVIYHNKMYSTYRIPKKRAGQFRRIDEPNARLKQVQKAIAVTFFSQDDASTPAHVGAYVKGRDVRHTMLRHTQGDVLISLDIEDFFGSTTRRMLREEFRLRGMPKHAARVLTDLLVLELRPKYSALPQGAPSSPGAANMIGERLIDAPVMELLPDNAVYTRYSDNLEISLHGEYTREEVDEIVRKVCCVIKDSGYRVSHGKTKIRRRNGKKSPQVCLGATVNEHPNIPRETYRTFRSIVYLLEKHGLGHAPKIRAIAHWDDVDNPHCVRSTLVGKLQYWSHINPKVTPLYMRAYALEVS